MPQMLVLTPTGFFTNYTPNMNPYALEQQNHL